MLKNILLYSIIYIIVTIFMSYDEIQCALNGENLCWYNLVGKYFIFILAILVYQKIIRPIIFKRKE